MVDLPAPFSPTRPKNLAGHQIETDAVDDGFAGERISSARGRIWRAVVLLRLIRLFPRASKVHRDPSAQEDQDALNDQLIVEGDSKQIQTVGQDRKDHHTKDRTLN